MDPVLMMLAGLALGGAVCAFLLSGPFAARAWAAPVLGGAAYRWAHPPDPPGPWDGLGLAYLLLFAAVWSTPFLFRAGVAAARWLNRRTAGAGAVAAAAPLSPTGARWLRRLDDAILVLVIALLASGFWPDGRG